MWCLLVTLAVAASADAGYLYNAPSASIRLPQNQLPNIHSAQYQAHSNHPVQGIHEEDKSLSYSVSYKDYVYLKQDNVDNRYIHYSSPSYNTHSVNSGIVLPNIQNNAGYSSNGFVGYSRPVAHITNYNKNYDQSYVLPAANVQGHQHYTTNAISNDGRQAVANIGYNNQAILTPVNPGYQQTNYAPASYSNQYVQSPTGVQHNPGYAQSLTAPDINNYNSYHQVSAPLAPAANLNNGGYNSPAQPTATAAGSYSNGYAQATPQAPVNSGYSQAAHNSAPFSHGYNQASTNLGGNNFNSDYSHSVAAASNLVSNNEYTHTVSTATTDHNNGFVQTSVSSVSSNFNNDQTLTSTGTSTLNGDYSSLTAVSGVNVQNDFTPTIQTTASGISSTNNLQSSTGPTHIDLNVGLNQALPLSGSGLDSSFTQTLTSGTDNLNNGIVNSLVQSSLNPAVNLPQLSVPANPPVTPIIHKHIYFHVPPPEIEEPPKVVPPPPPPKKNYRIIFIKVPSQESKSNIAYLQEEIARRQTAANEDRTLIYVLVKNPEEPRPVVLPEPKPSEHEVFFVKYNGSPFDIASQINEELDKTGSVKSIVPLEPGLVNGQHE